MLIFSDFKLLSPTGLEVGSGLMGLLTIFDRTVCFISRDDFDNATADAICREMGSSGRLDWTFGINWPIQNEFSKRLSRLSCMESESGQSVCEYDLDRVHDCSRNEDVFLTCNLDDESGKFFINHLFYFGVSNSPVVKM